MMNNIICRFSSAPGGPLLKKFTVLLVSTALLYLHQLKTCTPVERESMKLLVLVVGTRTRGYKACLEEEKQLLDCGTRSCCSCLCR